MRRALQTLALLCLFALPAFGQGALYSDRVQAVDGRAIGGVTVTVCAYSSGQYNSQGQYTGPIPCTPAVTAYYDPALAHAITNPFTTDSQGNVWIYLPPNLYTVTYSAPNLTPRGFSIAAPCAPGSVASTCSGSNAPLTSTQVGFGSASNLLSGDSSFIFSPSTKNLSVPSINQVLYVDGVNYGSISAADAFLGSNPGTIMDSAKIGTSLVGPFTLNANHTIQCYQGGAITASGGPTTISSGAGIVGQPIGQVYTTTGNCVIKAANSSNLAEVFNIGSTGVAPTLRDIAIDGNVSANPSGGPVVLNLGTRLRMQNATIQNSPSDGIVNGSAVTPDLGQANFFHDSVINASTGAGLKFLQTIDSFMGPNLELENNQYCINATGADSMRITQIDCSGGSSGGINVSGSNLYNSDWWNIMGSFFGGNVGPDIQETNSTPTANAVFGWNVIGNHFINPGSTTNTESPFYARDSGYTVFMGNNVTSNIGGAQYKYGIDIGQTTGTEQPDIIMGNTFVGPFGTACYNTNGLKNTTFFANICGSIPVFILPNNIWLQWWNPSGAAQDVIELGSDGNTYLNAATGKNGYFQVNATGTNVGWNSNGLFTTNFTAMTLQLGSVLNCNTTLGSLGTDSSGNVGCNGGAGGAFNGGLGTSYQDVTGIVTPANPASGNARLYYNSSTLLLACITSSGANCMPSGGSGSGANTALSNLVATSINQSLVVASGSAGTLNLGTALLPWGDLYIGSLGANKALDFNTSNLTANRTIIVPDAGGTFAVSASGSIQLSTSGNITCPACPTSYTPPLGISGTTVSITGAAGQVLAGSAPAFTATPTLGTAGSALGTLTLAASAASASLTLSPASVATSYTLTFPSAAGTTGNLLAYGTPMTWVSPTVTVNGTACTLGSTCAPSAAASLSSLTAATAGNSINNGTNAQTWNWQVTGSSPISALSLTENAASTNSGASYLFNVHTLSGSTISPFIVTAGGTSNGWQMSTAALLEPLGSGAIALGGTAHSLPITEGTSSAINFLNSPTTNGYCVVGFNVTASAGVDPTCALQGVPVNSQSTSYTLLYSDRASYILETAGTTATLTIPAHTTAGFGSNFPFVTFNGNSGTETVTATSPDTINGGSAGGSVSVSPNWTAWFYNDASGNWHMFSLPSVSAFNGGTNCGDSSHALNFISGVIGCQSIAGGGGSGALSSITAATATNTISSGNFGSQIWEWSLTTASTNALQLTESAAGTATGSYLLNVTTLSGSTTVPMLLANSLSGSQTLPTLSITPTWNTTGVVDAALLVNVTNTASGAGSLLIDLQVGGTSEWTVDKSGNANASTSISTGTAPSCAPGTGGLLCLAEGTDGTGASAVDMLVADSTLHGFKVNPNNAGWFDLPYESTAFTTNGVVYATAANTFTSTSYGATGTVLSGNGSGSAPSFIDFPQFQTIPAANCNAGTAGAGWSIPSASGGTPTCRAGTNNLGGYVSIADSTTAQFSVVIPEDWDSGSNPYIRFQVASADTTSGHTVIPQIKVSCAKGDGSTTDDVGFNAAHSSSTVTLNTTANQFWSSSNVQMNSTDMTGCVAGALMIVQVGRATDTATSAYFYSATLTWPRRIVVQAN